MNRIAALTLASALASCAVEVDPSLLVQCPDAAEFAAVSPVIEQRCGSLDCHGSIARPFRVYGSRGLRHVDVTDPGAVEQLTDPALAEESGTYPGTDGKATPTTVAEREQTRRSACGLEPEKMSRLHDGDLRPEDLLLLRKPLAIERHKGDQVFIRSSSDYVCLTSWLAGEVNLVECDLALRNP